MQVRCCSIPAAVRLTSSPPSTTPSLLASCHTANCAEFGISGRQLAIAIAIKGCQPIKVAACTANMSSLPLTAPSSLASRTSKPSSAPTHAVDTAPPP